MATPYESADLLVKLYDLRREDKMREARDWFFREFHPASVNDIMDVLRGPHSGHYRMVTSYWDMACSFVVNNAIDEQMFNDANGEQIGIFAKLEPFLGEYRTMMGNPKALANLEKVVLRRPGINEMLAGFRERIRMMREAAAR